MRPGMTTPVRVRFAPSPTGFLHIGGARTALYNYLYARQQGGTFVLRIEDTDTQRSTQEYTDAILDGMRWLGLTWDEGPYFQMQRADIHTAHIQKLFDAGAAYRCTCTTEQLEQMRADALARSAKPTYDRRCRDLNLGADCGQSFCVRFKAPLDGQTIVRDMVRGEIPFENKELDDLVIVRSDGTPTYNFVVVVDDVTMHITHVIRGDDHLNNTPRQIMMYEALGYPVPQFAHLPMILGADKQRLSKRHGATSVNAYQDMGYLPEALLNYLARLGWSHGDQEIFTMNEMITHFSFDHVGKAGAIFNPDKLDWVNAEHLKKYSNEQLLDLAAPYLQAIDISISDRVFAARALASERERAKTLKQLAEVTAFYFRAPQTYDDAAVQKWLRADDKAMLRAIRETLGALADWSDTGIKPALEQLGKDKGCKFVAIAQPIRVALTGCTVSPGIYEVLAILGRDESLGRIDAALDTI